MLRRVQIQDWQKVTEADFNNFGLFPRQSFDFMLGDLGPGHGFAGFAVAQNGPASVILGPGRLYTLEGPFYFIADTPGAEIDFLGQLPVVTRRWAAITVWGQEIETQTEPRTFLTDASSRSTVARVVSTESRRHVNHSPVYGVEGPDPQRPPIPTNVLAVAYVLLGPTGIISIEMNEAVRAESIRRLGLKANDLDTWRARTGTRIDTLGSDLASLAARIVGLAPLNFTLDISRDVARLKENANLPQDYTQWSADHFLTQDHSDPAHVDYLAKVEEGVRFPPAAEREAQIALLNPYDQTVVNQNNFILPKYSEIARLTITGNDGELSVSQFQFQTVNWTLMSKGRMRVRYGTPFGYCSNTVYWDDTGGREIGGTGVGSMTGVMALQYDPVQNIFIRPATGETFQILDAWQDTPGHYLWRLQQYWVDEIVDYYLDRVVTVESFGGAVVAETFLNVQDGWITSIDLWFTRIASEGDVQVLLVETEHGAPEFDRVICRTTVPANSLKQWPNFTKVQMIPTFVVQGKRYGIVIQTSGNHFLAIVTGNKNANGMLFQATGAMFAMGDVTRDITFRLNFAQFDVPRIAVQLTSLELQNGIAAIDLNVDSIRPPACSTQFEVQVAGVWTAFAGPSGGTNALGNLPPLLPLRVVLTGTTDVMPGIGVGPNGWAKTWRPRSDFRHISAVQTLPLPCNVVYVDVLLEQWRDAPYQTCVVKLLSGSGFADVDTPTAIEDRIIPNDPSAMRRRCTFELDSPVMEFRIRIEGTTDNVLACSHVAERVQVSLGV
jgi:hypothetical protein